MRTPPHSLSFFFFNDTATTEIYTLSLHDALPISRQLHEELPERAPLLRVVGRTSRPRRERSSDIDVAQRGPGRWIHLRRAARCAGFVGATVHGNLHNNRRGTAVRAVSSPRFH